MALNVDERAGWTPSHTHGLLSALTGRLKREERRISLPPLLAGERLLLSVCDANGRPVALTDRALRHQENAPDGKWVRLPWELVGSVAWDIDRQTLTLTGLTPTVPRTVLRMPDGAQAALLARERVEWTSMIQTRVDLGEHGSLRVLARRIPGTEDLVWVVALDDGVDAAAPAVQAAVDAVLARLRAEMGRPASRPEPDPTRGSGRIRDDAPRYLPARPSMAATSPGRDGAAVTESPARAGVAASSARSTARSA